MERSFKSAFVTCQSQDHPDLFSSVRRIFLHYCEIQCQAKCRFSHTVEGDLLPSWAALGVAAGHHVVQHLSTTTQLEKAQPWPLHFSDSSAACTKPLSVLKHDADQCSTGKGIKCDCPSRGLSFQRPHHPR